MNQIIEWNGTCQRCYEETKEYTMSVKDVSLICKLCSEKEAETDSKNLKKRV